MNHAVSRALERAQSLVKCEISLNADLKSQAKLSKEKVQEIYKLIMDLLRNVLEFFEGNQSMAKFSKNEIDHKNKLLQCCLVFTVANRNVSRVSSAIYLKKYS